MLPDNIYARGGNIKDYIAPSIFVFRNKEIEVGESFTRILYMSKYDRNFDDEFIRDLLDNNKKIAVSKHIKRIDKTEALDKVRNNIFDLQGKIQTRLEKNHQKGLDFVPYRWQEKAKELDDLQVRLSDSTYELFRIGIFVSVSAKTKEELDELYCMW